MASKRVLIISPGATEARALRGAILLANDANATTWEEGALGADAWPRDLVVYQLASNEGTGGVEAALLAESRSGRPAPVLVVDEAYDEAAALLFLQLGAIDYVGVREHSDRLGAVIAQLLALDADSGELTFGVAYPGIPDVAFPARTPSAATG
jgi:hypothetical protein